MTPHAFAGSPPATSRVVTITRFGRVRRPARPAAPPRTRLTPINPLALTAQHAAPAQNPFGDRQQLAQALLLAGAQRPAQRGAGRGGDLGAARAEQLHVLLVAGVSERPAQLDQQSLDPNLKLKGGLAGATGVEVEAGAGEHRLAGVELLAPAEHRCQPLLGADVCLVPRPPATAGAGLELARRQPLALRHLLAASVADPDRDRPLAAQLVHV